MEHLRWVPSTLDTLTAAKMLSENTSEEAFKDSAISGYRIAACCSKYGNVRQRWLVVESQAREDADLKQLSKAQSQLRQLSQQEFACSKDAFIAAQRLNYKLPLHQLAHIHVKEVKKHTGRGRPSKDASPTFYYQVDATNARTQGPTGTRFNAIDFVVDRGN